MVGSVYFSIFCLGILTNLRCQDSKSTESYIKIHKYRINDINLNIGVWDEKGEKVFYIINTPTLNTFSIEEANSYSKQGNYFIKDKISIKVDTIDNIINKYNNGIFPDFLSIDAEGVEELILKSIDYETNYPKIICVETISFANDGTGDKNEGLINFLIGKGYMLYADTYINSIFVRTDLWKRNSSELTNGL